MSEAASGQADHFRFHAQHEHLSTAFGTDRFGARAERLARFFGTPKYIAVQTAVVIVWIIFNGFEILVRFDKYPFILLNLAFSTQAAYAAPLILLAQTRQAERDKAHADADARHREELAKESEKGISLIQTLLEQNTQLTRQVEQLTREIHGNVCTAGS